MPKTEHTVFEVLQDRWWVALAAMVISLIATPIFRAVAYRFKIVDRPDDLLKPHGRPVAYLGGLGIWVGAMMGLCCYLAFMPGLRARWSDLLGDISRLDLLNLLKNPLWNLLGIMLSSTVIMIVGLLDDLKDISPKQKISGQVLAAGVLLASGVGLQTARLFFLTFGFSPPPWLYVPLSILLCLIFIIGACNATNLLDGLDGLCGGVTGIISLGFLALAVWLAIWENDPNNHIHELRIGLALAIVGTVLGFLPYNVPPASIFMGDAGSMFLGFSVATLMILFCREGNARWLLAALVVYSLPILDTGLALVRRLLAGVSIFAGDRSHLYDQLIDRGMSVRKVVALFYSLALGVAVVGVCMAIWVSGRLALAIYAALFAAVWVIFWKMGMIHPESAKPHDADESDPLTPDRSE